MSRLGRGIVSFGNWHDDMSRKRHESEEAAHSLLERGIGKTMCREKDTRVRRLGRGILLLKRGIGKTMCREKRYMSEWAGQQCLLERGICKTMCREKLHS